MTNREIIEILLSKLTDSEFDALYDAALTKHSGESFWWDELLTEMWVVVTAHFFAAHEMETAIEWVIDHD